ncbi:MAG TPA: ATP-binding cassette domain-containing protein, partial [Armatimonadota bacterium]
LRAVDGVSLDLRPGETLALVGESGSGKSTLARLLLHLLPATSGSVRYRGEEVLRASGPRLRALRRHLQIVFQDPLASLSPRQRIGQIVREPLEVHRLARSNRPEVVAEALRRVGLDPALASRYPHELSGGQRQRVGIARALVSGPEVVVLDEPVSALDVSVRAQIVNLLQDLQEQMGLAYLFIAHDLALVRHISHRVAVMHRGRLMELAPAPALFESPQHPYTQALLAAVPRIRTAGEPLSPRSRIPLPDDLPRGPLVSVMPDHWVASQE